MSIFEQLITPEPVSTPLQLAPCVKCGDPLRWYDTYGGGPHCPTCKPVVKILLLRKEMITLDRFGQFQVESDFDDQEFEVFEVNSRRVIQRTGYGPKQLEPDPLFPEDLPREDEEAAAASQPNTAGISR